MYGKKRRENKFQEIRKKKRVYVHHVPTFIFRAGIGIAHLIPILIPHYVVWREIIRHNLLSEAVYFILIQYIKYKMTWIHKTHAHYIRVTCISHILSLIISPSMTRIIFSVLLQNMNIFFLLLLVDIIPCLMSFITSLYLQYPLFVFLKSSKTLGTFFLSCFYFTSLDSQLQTNYKLSLHS